MVAVTVPLARGSESARALLRFITWQTQPAQRKSSRLSVSHSLCVALSRAWFSLMNCLFPSPDWEAAGRLDAAAPVVGFWPPEPGSSEPFRSGPGRLPSESRAFQPGPQAPSLPPPSPSPSPSLFTPLASLPGPPGLRVPGAGPGPAPAGPDWEAAGRLPVDAAADPG